MGALARRLRDPVSWALKVANHPHRALAEVFRECQVEALHFGVEVGKAELLNLAIDTEKRISQRLAATSASINKT